MKDGLNISLMQRYVVYGVTAYVPAFGPVFSPLLNRGVVLAFAQVRAAISSLLCEVERVKGKAGIIMLK